MYKFVALFALFACALAAPAPGNLAVVQPAAVVHSSHSSVVHHPAPLVTVRQAVPVITPVHHVHSVPVVPVVRHAHPVIAHHPTIVRTAVPVVPVATHSVIAHPVAPVIVH